MAGYIIGFLFGVIAGITCWIVYEVATNPYQEEDIVMPEGSYNDYENCKKMCRAMRDAGAEDDQYLIIRDRTLVDLLNEADIQSSLASELPSYAEMCEYYHLIRISDLEDILEETQKKQRIK